MELSRKSCRLCLSETEFNVSLFGNYCRRTKMVDKIQCCLKLVIEESNILNTICYRCAENVEKYYDFMMFVKKSQSKLVKPVQKMENSVNRRLIASYVREQVYDADYTFSCLDVPEEKEQKASSPFFSYFSPPNMMVKHSDNHLWKTKPCEEIETRQSDKHRRTYKKDRSRHQSLDLFESQSQDDEELRTLDWKLTPDNNIMKIVQEKCFRRSNF